MFDQEDDAKAWAESLKGLRAIVNIDPRDPTRSASRDEELDAVAPVPPWRA